MKKLFITAIAFLVFSSTAMAGGHVDSVRYLTTKFWQNWFVTVDGSVNWWRGSDRNPAGNYTAVQWNKPSYGGSFNVGKWINHKFGIRYSYDVNPGKSYINGLHAKRPILNHLFYGTFDYDENYATNGVFTYTPDGAIGEADANGYYNTHFWYHNSHVDLFFSPIDIFQGYYNPYRLYTPVFYVGMGAACVSRDILINPDVINNYQEGKPESEGGHGGNDFYQQGVNFELSYNFGMMNNFRISDHFDLHFDFKGSLQRWNIDSWFYEYLANYEGVGNVIDEEAIRPRRTDANYSIGVGFTYYFSRIYELPNNCNEQMNEFKNRLNMFVNAPADPDTVFKFVHWQSDEMISWPFSIFFNRDSYQLMSGRDLVNLRELANIALEYGYKIRLRGSCDSATASSSYNQTLSENRCRRVMAELLEMGVPENQIILMPVGGVKHLDPTEYDRRVLVELVKVL